MNTAGYTALFGMMCGLLSVAATADDLETVYQEATVFDRTYMQAQLSERAERSGKTQAILSLIPLNVGATKTWSGLSGSGVGAGTQYQPATLAATAQVNLFSWDSWMALREADHTLAQAEAALEASKQDLISRVVQKYFGVLSAEEEEGVELKAVEAAQSQVEQAEARLKEGDATQIDVDSAVAQRDGSLAALAYSRQQLASSKAELRVISGNPGERLVPLKSQLPLTYPAPNDENVWSAMAKGRNPSVLEGQLAVQLARDNYLTAYGERLPAVSLQAQRSIALQSNRVPGVQQLINGGSLEIVDTKDTFWSLSISVPLFTAGLTASRVHEARLQWQAAQANFEGTELEKEASAKEAFDGVTTQVAQVGYLTRAEFAAESALKAALGGYQAGVKSSVDVVSAQKEEVQAASNLVNAKYGYINDLVALKLAAGSLSESDISYFAHFLVAAD